MERFISWRDILAFAAVLAVVAAVYWAGSGDGYARGERAGRESVWAACREPGNLECPAYNGGGGVDKSYVR